METNNCNASMNKSSFYKQIVDITNNLASNELNKKFLECQLKTKIKRTAQKGLRSIETAALPYTFNETIITDELMQSVLKILRDEGFEVSDAQYNSTGLHIGPSYTIKW